MSARNLMIGISRLEDLARDVTRYFEKLPASNRVPRIVGVVFCQPESILDPKEQRELIEYYNFRSGHYINFYFVGYEFSTGPDKAWLFNPHYFNECREEMQRACAKWRYSGDTDLILFNVKHDPKADCATIDFENAEPIDFGKIKMDVTLPTVGKVFEQIFQYCEDYYGQSRTFSADDGNAKHLRETIAKKFPSASIEIQNATDRLDVLMAASISKFAALNLATQANATKAEAVANQIKKVMDPFGDMYKNPRLADARSEAMRAGVPELVVDAMVRNMHVLKFPTTDRLLKELYATGAMKGLKATSRATVGRWHGIFRRILVRHGLIEPYRVRSAGTKPKQSISSEKHPSDGDDVAKTEETGQTKRDSRRQELTEGGDESDSG
jgi:hypothetical protein